MAFMWDDFLNASTAPIGTPLQPITIDPRTGLPTQRVGSGLMPVDATRNFGGGLIPVNPVQAAPAPNFGGGLMPVSPVPVAGSAPALQNAPVYRPGFGQNYPGTGQGLYNTPFVRDYLSPLLPEGEYKLRLNRLGMGDPTTRYGQFGQSQYGNTQRAYQTQQLKQPGLSFRDFLRRGGAGDLRNTFKGMTAGQRGLSGPARTSIVRLG